MAAGGLNLVVAAGLAILACLPALGPPAAAASNVDEFLEGIRSQMPSGPSEGVTPTGGSSPASFTNGTRRNISSEIDEASLMRALALGRRAGIGVGPGDVGTKREEGVIEAANDGIPPPGPALDLLRAPGFDSPVVTLALTALVPYSAFKLEVPPVPITRLQRHDELFVERYDRADASFLPEQEAMSALVLLSGGIPFDAKDAFTTSRAEDRVTAYDEEALLSPAVASAFAVLGIDLAEAVHLDDLHDESLIDEMRLRESRSASMPEDVALAAVALRRAGLEVDGADVASFHASSILARSQAAERESQRANLLSALLLR